MDLANSSSRRLGAVPVAADRVEFRVWAPAADQVDVVLPARKHSLETLDGSTFASVIPARPGEPYRFVLDGGTPLPDPCSRAQPDGLRGPSHVLDTASFRRHSLEPPALELDRLVIYELHVGTFTPEGTFAAATRRLPALAQLGITAVELMPVATFPGERGWGYDGVLTYAPHRAYGGPAGLVELVDAAHASSLGVILDVVYNHIGPGSELVTAFGPYTTNNASTAWGDALDYAQPGVREWAIQNAELWIRDYRVDGLRLDAVHSIYDGSPVHVLRELRDRVKAINPCALVISELGTEDLRPLEEWGHDAMWLDSLHHHLHVLLTGERAGYYESFGSVDGLVRELQRPGAERFVVCAQNHDQIGNRAFGDRLSPADHRIALAVVLFSLSTPLLFMGEEYDESQPFRYFTDHDDPRIAAATREGRRREFAGFEAFAGRLPDPQAEETFLTSKLEPGTTEPLYRELLELRRQLPRELDATADGLRLTLRRGPATLVADFAAKTVELRR